MKAVSGLVVGLLLMTAVPMSWAGEIFVNGVRLEDATRQALERGYGVPIKPGRYWYDPVSGVWGVEGGPGQGQIQPALPLGGPLQRDASRGKTGVIVNGRELHALDVAALERCLTVSGSGLTVWAGTKGNRPNSISRCSAEKPRAGRAPSVRTTAAAGSLQQPTDGHRYDRGGRWTGSGLYRRQSNYDAELNRALGR